MLCSEWWSRIISPYWLAGCCCCCSCMLRATSLSAIKTFSRETRVPSSAGEDRWHHRRRGKRKKCCLRDLFKNTLNLQPGPFPTCKSTSCWLPPWCMKKKSSEKPIGKQRQWITQRDQMPATCKFVVMRKHTYIYWAAWFFYFNIHLMDGQCFTKFYQTASVLNYSETERKKQIKWKLYFNFKYRSWIIHDLITSFKKVRKCKEPENLSSQFSCLIYIYYFVFKWDWWGQS